MSTYGAPVQGGRNTEYICGCCSHVLQLHVVEGLQLRELFHGLLVAEQRKASFGIGEEDSSDFEL